MTSNVCSFPGDSLDTTRMVAAAHSAIRAALDAIAHLPAATALGVVADARRKLDAHEAALLAVRLDAGASPRAIENDLQLHNNSSKRTAVLARKRAAAVQTNPDLSRQLAAGVLSADQTDVIAHAAAQTNGAAANDQQLISRIAGTTPEQGRKVADEWIRHHLDPNQLQSEHNRHRRMRNIRRSTGANGVHRLILEGDRRSIDEIEATIRALSNQLYQTDGGRDITNNQHPRTHDQRNFDAAHRLLTQTNTHPKTTHKPRRSERARSAATTFVTMTIDQAAGRDLTPIRHIGAGPLPASVQQQLACDATIIGQVFDTDGAILWQGHAVRTVTDTQWLALVSRDGGCVQCDAHYSVCHAHHLIPWESALRGPTDINNLALVCPSCHTDIHEREQTLQPTPNGQWKLRPALPEEIAPKQTTTTHRRKPSLAEARQRAPGQSI